MSNISRRNLLLGSGAALLGGACSSTGDSGTPNTFEAVTTSITQPPRSDYSLAAMFPAAEGFLVSGINQRMPFRIAGKDGAPIQDLPQTLTAEIFKDNEVVAEPPVNIHVDGIGSSYITLDITFSDVGIHTIVADIEGFKASSSVQVFNRSEVSVPQVGDQMPALTTPTVSDELGFKPMCTADPPCSLHEQSLSDALGSGKVAFYVGTPAYCQIGVCGPLLEMLEKEAEANPEITFIHAEVYTDANDVDNIINATPAPAMTELGLTYEPVLFVIDETGAITTRLDTIFDSAELQAALA